VAANPIRVSQLNGYIKRVLQSDPILGRVSVVGEISNLRHHGNGHVYFSLKDDRARVNCFLPSDVFAGLGFELADGIESVVSGYVSVYENGGTYSLNVRGIEMRGAGSPAIAFAALKEKLAGEGLFDKRHKKPLPSFPARIAIVTSATGAAIEDMVTIITAKNDYTDILICPTLVQGSTAAAQIADRIAYVNRARPDTDVIIVGRGGGSVEDLWAFNEEAVARAIFASRIPVISAVGHETDVTIADFVADVRAETPTAAAQMAVPDIGDIRAYLTECAATLNSGLTDRLERLSLRVGACDTGRMRRAILAKISHAESEAGYAAREAVMRVRERVAEKRHTAELRIGAIEALNPRAILRRGYAALTDGDGRIIASARQLREGMALRAILGDGSADVTVDRVERGM
jgi:exodeoxyribonuclease VII large subunit